RGHVSRQDRRIRRQEDIVHQPAAPLHRGAVVGGAGAQSQIEAPAPAVAGRRAEPDQPAAGLRLSYPLPLCRRALQDRDAETGRDQPRPRGVLPSADELNGKSVVLRNRVARFATLALLASLILGPWPAVAGSDEPLSVYMYDDTKRLVSLVEDAADLVKREGEAAFTEFA